MIGKFAFQIPLVLLKLRFVANFFAHYQKITNCVQKYNFQKKNKVQKVHKGPKNVQRGQIGSQKSIKVKKGSKGPTKVLKVQKG